MKRSHLYTALATVLVATVVMAAAADGAPSQLQRASTPGLFIAKYHVSGYGVYHRTNYFDYTAAPCQVGGKGGGDDGVIRNDTTIRWETAAPETIRVEKIAGGQPAAIFSPGPGIHAQGIVANVTVTSKVTNSVENVTCNLDGSEDRLAVPAKDKCGTHTYTRGYYATVEWPHPASTASGQRIATGLVPLNAQKVGNDWHECYGAHYQYDENAAFVSVPLPFSQLPRKIRGKLTVIPHGHETVIDSTHPQNGQGGTIHQYDAYHETNYVTWIRVG